MKNKADNSINFTGTSKYSLLSFLISSMLSNITRSCTAKGLKLNMDKLTVTPITKIPGLFTVTHADEDGTAILDENFCTYASSRGFSFCTTYVPTIISNIARVRGDLDFRSKEYEYTLSPCKKYFLRIPLKSDFLATFPWQYTVKYKTFVFLFKELQEVAVKDVVSNILNLSMDLIRCDHQFFNEVYI